VIEMKKIIFGVLLSAAICAILFWSLLPGLFTPQLKDCGTDKQCFVAAAQNCEEAKAVFVENDGTIESKLYMETKGRGTGTCKIHLKVDDFKLVEFSETPTTVEIINKINSLLDELKGATMECNIPTDKISLEMLEHIDKSYCTGDLKNKLTELNNKIQQLS